MIHINPTELTERENYKLLIGSVIPRPIAFVTTVSSEGTINGAPFSYFNVVTADPPMLSLSIQRKNGEQKDTAKHIIEQENFVVHIVSEPYLAQINETAASLPSDKSELTVAKLTSVPSKDIATPGIKESKVRYECVLEKYLPLGGKGTPSTDFFIGRIKAIHVDETVYEDGKINYDSLQAVSRLAGNDYAEVGKIRTIKRPD